MSITCPKALRTSWSTIKNNAYNYVLCAVVNRGVNQWPTYLKQSNKEACDQMPPHGSHNTSVTNTYIHFPVRVTDISGRPSFRNFLKTAEFLTNTQNCYQISRIFFKFHTQKISNWPFSIKLLKRNKRSNFPENSVFSTIELCAFNKCKFLLVVGLISWSMKIV